MRLREVMADWRERCFGASYPGTMALLALIGLAGSAGLALNLRLHEQQAWEQDLRLDAMQYQQATQQALDTVSADLLDIARFFETQDYPDQRKFMHFAGDRLSKVFSASWMPRIASSERAAFERAARLSNPGFRLYDITPGCVPADPRHGYAVLYQVTRPGHPYLFGLDVRCSAERLRIMARAERDNTVLATPLMSLYNSAQPGMIVFAPVWRKDANGVPSRAVGLRGFIGAAVNFGDVMSAQLRRMPGVERHRIQLLDVSDGRAVQLYSSSDQPLQTRVSWRHVIPIEFAGRSLKLWVVPGEALWAARNSSLPLYTFLTGALTTGLLILLLHSQVISRRRAEMLAIVRSDDLVDRENRLAALFSHASLGIVRCDLRNQVLEANEAAAQMLGCNPQHLRGRDFCSLFTPWSEALLRQRWQEPNWRELQLNSLSGEVIPVMVRGISLRLPSGEPYSWFLIDDLRQVRHAERLKMQFISTVSHELRTPLTAIKGAIELLREQAAEGEERELLLAMAGSNANQLHRLIDNLLDMEQLAQGALSLHPRRHSLRPLLTRALTLAEPLAAQKSLRLVLDMPETELEALVDAERLLQVISNLLSNAIKFSPVEADIVVSARREHDGETIITVRDQGEGIPAAFRARLFQPFAQADGGDDRRRGGTGLGLAISRSLVERMGGRIVLDAAEARGASFSIHLPLVPAA